MFSWFPWPRGGCDEELLQARVSPAARSHAGPSLPPAHLAPRGSKCWRVDSPMGRSPEKSRANLARSISDFLLQGLAQVINIMEITGVCSHKRQKEDREAVTSTSTEIRMPRFRFQFRQTTIHESLGPRRSGLSLLPCELGLTGTIAHTALEQ